MELRTGYKLTEVGVIPEDWGVAPLSDFISALEAGVSVNSLEGDGNLSGHDAWILKTSCVVGALFLPTEAKPIASHDVRRVSVSPLADTILVSRMNTPALVGECGYIDQDWPTLFLPDRLWMTRHNQCTRHWVRWLAYLLSYPAFSRTLKAAATGTSGSMKNISKASLLRVLVPLPPYAEQQAIAEALSDADALIESLEQLLAKKGQIKQGAMQELLTGKTRLPGFSGEWEVKQLGEIGNFLKGSGVTRDQSTSGSIPCVRYGEIYTRHDDHIRAFHSWISPEVAATATRLEQGDLLFAGSGETKEDIGKCVAFGDDVEAYAGGDIVILRPTAGDSMFLGYYLNMEPARRQKASRAQGDAVVHISAAAIGAVQLALPPLTEQTAIATILSDMDAELSAAEAKLAKARALKQGMMQELLTGAIRLV